MKRNIKRILNILWLSYSTNYADIRLFWVQLYKEYALFSVIIAEVAGSMAVIIALAIVVVIWKKKMR